MVPASHNCARDRQRRNDRGRAFRRLAAGIPRPRAAERGCRRASSLCACARLLFPARFARAARGGSWGSQPPDPRPASDRGGDQRAAKKIHRKCPPRLAIRLAVWYNIGRSTERGCASHGYSTSRGQPPAQRAAQHKVVWPRNDKSRCRACGARRMHAARSCA